MLRSIARSVLKRKVVLTAGVIVAALAGSASAQTAASGSIREALIGLDADSDGAIALEEVPDAGRAAFKRLLKRGDSDEDGKLSGPELRALGEKARGGSIAALPPAIAARLKAMDKNGDGTITRAEFRGPAAAFARLDPDGDGKVALPSRPAEAPSTAPNRLRRLRAMDQDGDGAIQRAEFTGPAPAFDRLDVNGDGVLDRKDFAAARPGS